jgi:hypothetical protein
MKHYLCHGAHDRNRTGDLVLTKDVLYRLSYVGTLQLPVELNPLVVRHSMERVMGIEPTPSAWKAEVLPLNYTRRGGGGGGRIRTYEGISQQIYSLPPLAAWVPLRGDKEPGILFTKVLTVNSKLTIGTYFRRPRRSSPGRCRR